MIKPNSPEMLPSSTGSAMVFTLNVSQGPSGVVYDLENQTYGEWMTVSRRKKVTREP